MSDNPEEIRRDIERTRRELSSDVDALTEKVSPTKVMERRVERARGAVSSMKEKVMGSASDTTSAAGGGLSTAQDKVSSAATTVTDTASAAPQVARQRTQGNPMAAGLIAFGAGWLVSSLIPASLKEQRAATAVKDKASEHSDQLTGPLSDAAQNLKEPAQQAAQSIKATATDAASTVKDETRSAKDDVAGQAKQSKDNVADQSGSSNGSTTSSGTGSGSTYGS